MTLDEIIDFARSMAGDRDSAAYRYTKNEIAVAIRDIRRSLGVKNVANLSGFTVDTTVDSEAISPEPSEIQGVILGTAAALQLLTQTYRERMDAGTIGISWQSGLEQESTINQEKAYRQMLVEIKNDLDVLILIDKAPNSATRPQ